MIICNIGSVHNCHVGHFGRSHNLLALEYRYSHNSHIKSQAQHFHSLLLDLPLLLFLNIKLALLLNQSKISLSGTSAFRMGSLFDYPPPFITGLGCFYINKKTTNVSCISSSNFSLVLSRISKTCNSANIWILGHTDLLHGP
mgnify:CR=1 FL=1